MNEVLELGDIKLLGHLIYELQKGMRAMALYTLRTSEVGFATKKISMSGLKFLVSPVSEDTANLFFGSEACLNVVNQICTRPLNQLSPEEDFMIGAMLGYDIRQQCERYTQRKSDANT